MSGLVRREVNGLIGRSVLGPEPEVRSGALFAQRLLHQTVGEIVSVTPAGDSHSYFYVLILDDAGKLRRCSYETVEVLPAGAPTSAVLSFRDPG